MTKSQKFVAESYAKYFGRAADADKIDYYGLKENGKAEKASEILKNIIADADAEKAELSKTEFVNNAFQNLFGRNATTKEMSKYYKVVDAGKDLPINSIVKSAAKTDKDVYNNKLEVAAKYAELGGKGDFDLSKISKGNLIKDIKTVTKLDDLLAKYEALADNSGIPSSFDGKTFTLTEGVDAGKDFTGTNKNDLFVADNLGATATATAVDTLDGGKGTDTFKLYDKVAGTTTGSLPTLKNIENVVIYDTTIATAAAGPAVVDLTKWDSVETLFLVRDANEKGYKLGKKVTTVNVEDKTTATATTLTFDKALTAANVGVNNAITAAGAAVGVTVNGAALKTLTVDAYGKESNVTLTQAAIETLNITGRADLTLDANSTIAGVKTVDGSKAEGNLELSKLTAMTSVKTGSGNDTVTLDSTAGIVSSGHTINLGAGNDKLVGDAGSVLASTTTVIDGGAGIDSLDASLVNIGNAGVFANFEILSLTTNDADLDLALVNKSKITGIEINGTTDSIVRNVSTSQSLAVNASGTKTTLLFKDAAGTADAYKINFNADNTVDTDAGTVVINKIENVTVNSVGKTGVANTIDLIDADAKSLVITGDKDLNVTFGASSTDIFGTTSLNATDGKGVATIDASTATGKVTIDTLDVGVAFNGLTIKGGTAGDSITLAAGQKAKVDAGAGDDMIKTAANGGTLTGGAGKDTFDISDSVLLAAGGGGTPPAELTEATGVVKVTITDLTVGDKIIFADKGTEVFTKTKLDVSGATNLDAALTTAFAGDGSTNGIINWFQYAGNTYIVENVTDSAIDAGDIVVKINGVVDLSNSTYVAGTDTLTIA